MTRSDKRVIVAAGVFSRTFKNLARKGIEPQVLYPAVRVPSKAALAESLASWQQHLHQDLVSFLEAGPTFLSINRFERTKVCAFTLHANPAEARSG